MALYGLTRNCRKLLPDNFIENSKLLETSFVELSSAANYRWRFIVGNLPDYIIVNSKLLETSFVMSESVSICPKQGLCCVPLMSKPARKAIKMLFLLNSNEHEISTAHKNYNAGK